MSQTPDFDLCRCSNYIHRGQKKNFALGFTGTSQKLIRITSRDTNFYTENIPAHGQNVANVLYGPISVFLNTSSCKKCGIFNFSKILEPLRAIYIELWQKYYPFVGYEHSVHKYAVKCMCMCMCVTSCTYPTMVLL